MTTQHFWCGKALTASHKRSGERPLKQQLFSLDDAKASMSVVYSCQPSHPTSTSEVKPVFDCCLLRADFMLPGGNEILLVP